MKKALLYILFLFCTVNIFGQTKKINFYDTAYFDISKSRYRLNPSDLSWVVHYGDIFDYWDDIVENAFLKKDGTYKIYADPDFTLLAAECTVVNGEFSGEWKSYYDNHQLRTSCVYKNGELNGPWISYNKNGHKYLETKYVHNKLDGDYTMNWIYNDNPYYWLDGKNGTFHYKNGIKQGETTYWTRRNTIQVTCNYKDDELEGNAVYINKNGDTLKVEYYKQGNLISERKIENSSYETTYELRIDCRWKQKNYSQVDSIFSNLDQYINLESLSINNNDKEDSVYRSIINKHIHKITQLPRLRSITISGRGFKNIPSEIFLCKNVTQLFINDIQPIQSLPNELLQLQNLTNIIIRSTKISNPQATIKLLSNLKNLKELALYECFNELPSNMHLLQQLDALYLGNYGQCIQKEMQILPDGIFQLKNLKSLIVCQDQLKYYHDRFNKELPNTLIQMYNTCFDKNTLVELQDLRNKRIADVKENDVIMAYDTETHKIDTALVLRVMKHTVDTYPIVTLSLSNGTSIQCTNNHPFWCKSQWLRADELRKNDILYVHDGKSNALQPVTITDLRISTENKEVYNITTTKHTYFANGILVHNK